MSIRVNIEWAEQIINSNHSARKQWLRCIIDQVQSRRRSIQLYLLTVQVIERYYQQQHQQRQACIEQLSDREKELERDLERLRSHQMDLKKQQQDIEQSLIHLRQEAEKHREKKTRCEQHYARLSFVPILRDQSKKKYLKARSRDWQLEQQLSEMRHALELCRDHLRIISKQTAAGQSEREAVCTEKQGSLDKVKGTSETLDYLKQGSEFWSGFDVYQAQVVLEAAQYILKNNRCKTSKKLTVDVDQLWIKTFKLACLEYGDRELYGEKHWNASTLKVQFDCSICQTSLVCWPRLTPKDELVCESCFKSIQKEPTIVSVSNHNMLRKLFHSLSLFKINIQM